MFVKLTAGGMKSLLEVRLQQHLLTPSVWVELTHSTKEASLIPEIMVVVKC